MDNIALAVNAFDFCRHTTTLVSEIHTDWEKKKSDDYTLFQKHYNERIRKLYSLERIVIKKFIKVQLPLASAGRLCVNGQIMAFDELHVYLLTKGGKVLIKGPQDPEDYLYFLPIPSNQPSDKPNKELDKEPKLSKEPSEELKDDP